MIRLPSQTELRLYSSDDDLDPSNPCQEHYLEKCVTEYASPLPDVAQPQSQPDSNRTAELQALVASLQKRNAQLENQLQTTNLFWDAARREVKLLHNSNFYKAARLYGSWRNRGQAWLKKFLHQD